jgi:prepilin-type N-terminal cleavage/methylation domain-containing protein
MKTTCSVTSRNRRRRGFTLLEMMVSIAVLLVISAGAFAAASYYQQSFASTEAKIDTVSGMRNAFVTLAQEVEQAGAVNFTPTTLAANVTANAAAQSVALTDASALFVGEKITVGTMAAQETVAITAISGNNVTGVFASNHSSGDPVDVMGVLAQGILTTSTSTQLQIIGDINGTGKLVYVRYTCDTANGVLTRDAIAINATSRPAGNAVVLVDNLTANPVDASGNATPCFSYQTSTIGSYTYYTNVAIQFSSQTQNTDPFSGSHVRTFDILNYAPRNVVMGYNLATAGTVAYLQATPTNANSLIP